MTNFINKGEKSRMLPDILAPAGNKASFLAALAAGADAVYCGLKKFSARMESKNFTIEQLACLTELAHSKNVKVFIALNSIIKQDELDALGKKLFQLNKLVKPDALIIQDLSLIQLARQTGFSGKIHLSTLTHSGYSKAFSLVLKKLGVSRIVLPRELNIDEIKTLALSCPDGLDLEVFIHGALCYGISGRCYWSSYLGGKSSLRGRCVQPCRRFYTQLDQTKRFFSCMDLSIDVLTKVLLPIEKVRTWKIEGRKKGPHYVYYTVKAYQILRDRGNDPKMKKEALNLLSRALGRTDTHYNFLPQRPQSPVNVKTQTGSGLFIGRISGSYKKPYLITREDLLPRDALRQGYEDDVNHAIIRVNRYVPKKGRLYLKPILGKRSTNRIPVFLVDRRENELERMLSDLEGELEKTNKKPEVFEHFKAKFPSKSKSKSKLHEISIYKKPVKKIQQNQTGYWLSPENAKILNSISENLSAKLWWWLSPNVWPDEEKEINQLIRFVIKKGSINFILNSPWQIAFFKDKKNLNLWAGPFCNIINVIAVETLASIGFSGAVISPELCGNDYLKLPKKSPLPLGIVISAHWPLCISKILSENLKTDIPFTSPKKEYALIKKYKSEVWVYPNWNLDISSKKTALHKAGYSMFLHILEPDLQSMPFRKRPGLWNWNLELQ